MADSYRLQRMSGERAKQVLSDLLVELAGIEADNTVKVRLQGACRGCPGARMTLKMGIERLLKEKVPATKEVVAVD